MMSESGTNQNGLSRIAVVLVGLIGGLALLVTFLAVRHTFVRLSPSRANIERLLKRRDLDQALSMAQRMPAAGADLEVVRARIWLAKAWQRQNDEHWADYGRNEDDWFSSEEIDQARTHLEKALALDANCADARHHLAIIFLEKGWYAEAEAQLMHILARDPGSIGARTQLAAMYAASDRPGEAERELKTAHELDPRSPAVAKNLSFLYRYHLNQPESAMVWSNRYLNLDPRGDRDRRLVKEELLNLLERYPEFVLREGQSWKRRSRFDRREATPKPAAGGEASR